MDDPYDVEELDNEIACARQQLEVNTFNVNELQRELSMYNFDEVKVLETLRGMKGKDASDMLCVLYKRMADVKKEMRELEVLVGNVELQELGRF